MDPSRPHPRSAPAPAPTPDPPAGWTAVEPRHLVSLAALARAGSFRAAARELGCSQSGVSQHVAQLERIVGAPLATRRPGSGEVALTRSGTALLAHVEPILATLHAARADLAALRGPAARTLRLGVAEHLATAVGARALAPFLRRRPGAEVVVSSSPAPERLAADLAAGRLDAVVGDLPDRRGVLGAELLAPEPYVLAAPARWGVVRQPGAGAGDLLEHLPVALAGGDPDARRVLAELRAAGFAGPAAADLPGAAALLAEVRAGRTAAVVPAAAAAAHDRDTVTLGLDGLVTPRAVAILWHGERRHQPLVDVLVAEALRVAACKTFADHPTRIAA